MKYQVLNHLASWRKSLVVLGCAALLAGNAWGQWGWTNAAGKKEFSDRPPPPSVPESKIFKRPSGAALAPVPSQPADVGASATENSKPPQKTSDLDQKVAEQEAEEKAKRDAEKADLLKKRKKERAENCERAKSAKATIESGVRLGRVNANGEREILDEAARAKEMERANQIMKSQCGPDPMASE